MTRIAIGGDFCPMGPIGDACLRGDAEAVFHDLLPILSRCDLRTLNLECPLVDSPSPIAKSGPVLGAPARAVGVLARAGIDAIGLANNHAMDHGSAGLEATMQACRAAGLSTFGAGTDLAEAGRVVVKTAGDLRVGFLGMTEWEFGVAATGSAGTNPLDPVSFVRTVRRHRDQWDHLVVLLHGGNEYHPVPRPSLRNMCRFLVEEGASAVICQHSHIAGCHEAYAGGVIVYGQGNLLFDVAGASDAWYSGMLLLLHVDGPRQTRLEPIAIEQSRPESGVRVMSGARGAAFLSAIEERSARLAEDGFVERQWNDFCERHREKYLRRLGTPNRLFRGIDRVLHHTRFFYGTPERCVDHLNLLRCESHREVLVNLLSRGLL